MGQAGTGRHQEESTELVRNYKGKKEEIVSINLYKMEVMLKDRLDRELGGP
jgi:hypothetical protein